MPPYNPATPSQLRQKIPATARSWNQRMIFHGVIQRATRGEMGAATPSTKTGNRANSPEFSRESPISLSIVPSSGSGESNPVRRLKHTIKKATNSSIFPLMPPEAPALSIPCYTSASPHPFKNGNPSGRRRQGYSNSPARIFPVREPGEAISLFTRFSAKSEINNASRTASYKHHAVIDGMTIKPAGTDIGETSISKPKQADQSAKLFFRKTYSSRTYAKYINAFQDILTSHKPFIISCVPFSFHIPIAILGMNSNSIDG